MLAKFTGSYSIPHTNITTCLAKVASPNYSIENHIDETKHSKNISLATLACLVIGYSPQIRNPGDAGGREDY